MAECRIFARLTKVDEARRAVIGRAVQEMVDQSDEVFDYAQSRPHFEAWSKAIADATDGKSLGNIRAMHGKIAAGKVTKIDFNDAEKAIDIETKIVDDAEWAKVLEGVYTGFSIGGKYVGKPVAEKIAKNGQEIEVKRYVAAPSEISLVDNPCVPSARFFEVVKAAGGEVVKVEFRKADPEITGTAEQVDELAALLNGAGKTMGDVLDVLKREFSTDERKQAAKEGQALPDGSFPIKTVGDLENAIRAFGRAKDKAAAKAHIIKRAKALGATDKLPKDWTEKNSGDDLQKGMWNVQAFAGVLDSLAQVARSAQYDFDEEGDGSPVPMQLRNAFAELAATFKSMAAEEVDECLAALKAHAAVGEDDEIEQGVEAATRAIALRKRLEDPATTLADLVALATEHGVDLKVSKTADDLKAAILAKGGKVDGARMQEIHDHAVSMGADCDAKKLAKAAPVDNAELTTLRAELAKAAARIEALEKQPAPNVVALRLARAVAKDDLGNAAIAAGTEVDPATIQLAPEDRIYNADKSVDWEMSRLMKARRLGLKLKTTRA